MQNLIPSKEQGISAVKDDGSAEGILKVKIQQGELIKIPINNFAQGLEYQLVFGGAGSAPPSSTTWNNGDGSGSGLNMTTGTAGIGINFCLVNTIIYGKVVGVRFRRLPTTPNFSVVIDGIPYDCPTYRQKPYSNNTMNISQDRESTWIVADDLPDAQHTVQIFLYPDLTVKTLVFYGFLVEKRVGYKEIEKVDFISSVGTLTASSVDISRFDSGSQVIKLVKSIIYQNTDTVARSVTINYNGIVVAKIYLTALGTSGDSCKYDFGTGINLGGSTGNLSHLADLTGKVNFTIIARS